MALSILRHGSPRSPLTAMATVQPSAHVPYVWFILFSEQLSNLSIHFKSGALSFVLMPMFHDVRFLVALKRRILDVVKFLLGGVVKIHLAMNALDKCEQEGIGTFEKVRQIRHGVNPFTDRSKTLFQTSLAFAVTPCRCSPTMHSTPTVGRHRPVATRLASGPCMRRATSLLRFGFAGHGSMISEKLCRWIDTVLARRGLRAV